VDETIQPAALAEFEADSMEATEETGRPPRERENGRRGNRRRRGRRGDGEARRNPPSSATGEEIIVLAAPAPVTDEFPVIAEVSEDRHAEAMETVLETAPPPAPDWQRSVRTSRSSRHRGIRAPGQDRELDTDESPEPILAAEPVFPIVLPVTEEPAAKEEDFIPASAAFGEETATEHPETEAASEEEEPAGPSRRTPRRRLRSRRERRPPVQSQPSRPVDTQGQPAEAGHTLPASFVAPGEAPALAEPDSRVEPPVSLSVAVVENPVND
jgi:hypothetical protein